MLQYATYCKVKKSTAEKVMLTEVTVKRQLEYLCLYFQVKWNMWVKYHYERDLSDLILYHSKVLSQPRLLEM